MYNQELSSDEIISALKTEYGTGGGSHKFLDGQTGMVSYSASKGNIVGVRRETIMRLENAKYNPSLKLAVDISRILEVPIEEIFVFE
ncbi:MAG: hypothetical protein ATN35_09410 [Epulopiscium sp. Nele67-Bin004]|nr:MAG: hypothetical protein ATN35_09410 [Epulopiscium sp. Nele67-Bin004]